MAAKLDYEPVPQVARRPRIFGAICIVLCLAIAILGGLGLRHAFYHRNDAGSRIAFAFVLAIGLAGIFLFVRVWQGRIKL